jgi:hypothetical protein
MQLRVILFSLRLRGGKKETGITLCCYVLLGLTMRRWLPTRVAVLAQFEALRIVFLILGGGIVAAFAGCASQRHHNAILFAFASHNSLRLPFGLTFGLVSACCTPDNSWGSTPIIARWAQLLAPTTMSTPF